MKELRLEELTPRQKLGMVMTAHIYEGPNREENTAYALEMIKNHALGAIWIGPGLTRFEETMAAVKEAADYPILIVCDAESGMPPYTVGRHNAIGCTGDPHLAYVFGKVTAVTARKKGYNVICNPVLDMVTHNAVCGATVRGLGSDKYKVTELALAEARGLHDGGVLTVGKHYPGSGEGRVDSHMAESSSPATLEELLDFNLFPYLALLREGLLDGIMTKHSRFHNIDPDYPASLSKKVIGIIRDQGFDGFAITDALVMMGIAAKFGARTCRGLAIANGNDLALTWGPNQEGYESICETYDQGLIPDERLDEAVSRVLAAQHKTLSLPQDSELTETDLEEFDSINKNGVFAKTDPGLSTALDREGRHYFVVLTENNVEINDAGKVNVDTLLKGWYRPDRIMEKLLELFPNSTAVAINQFPSPGQSMHLLERSVDYDDVVFVTFMESQAYVGRECLTSRIVSDIEALQITNRVSTLVHFGNPFVLEELPHIPRFLIGGLSTNSVEYTLDVLAGKYPAKGVLTYDVKLP